MKKIIAVIGSGRKGNTYKSVQMIEKRLKEHDKFEFEYLFLSKYDLKLCNGCKLCFDKGEQYCPLKDDRDAIIEKLEQSDGVIIGTPNYAFGVSARTKNFLDRLAFVYHRPRFFQKLWMPVVTQGIYGGRRITKYLQSSGENLGFKAVRGACVNTLEPMTESGLIKMEKSMVKAADELYRQFGKFEQTKPSLFRQMMFCMTRTGIKHANVKLYDYEHFEKSGWFEGDYYYPVRFNGLRKIIGHIFDSLGKSMAQSR